MGLFREALHRWTTPAPAPAAITAPPPASPKIEAAAIGQLTAFFNDAWTGEKYPGGFGTPRIIDYFDYTTLRIASQEIWTRNAYARRLIRVLVQNEIGTGLRPEIQPLASYLGIDEDTATDWGDKRE